MAGLMGLEAQIVYNIYGKTLWRMRTQPAHAAHALAGVVLPSHERLWLVAFFGDNKTCNVLASRGTSKSYTFASMAAPLKAILYANVAALTLSRSGFRGGKELFKDAERMILGQLRSQKLPGAYLKASMRNPKIITKDPSMWSITVRSNSYYSTVPTNNMDQLRGLRATDVLLDERAFMPDELPHKIILPMLNVGQDFLRAAQGGDKNKLWQFSTIDYAIRGWWKELQSAQELQRVEYAAHKARKSGDWQEYDNLMAANEGRLRSASFYYSRVDYTDLIIPEFVNTLDGETRYCVHYPLEPNVTREDRLKYEEGEQLSFWYTYPVDKKGLEDPLKLGNVDEDLWLAEQRNIPLSTTGNVFNHELISQVSERPIWAAKDAPRGRKRSGEDESANEYYAPVMYSCGDPCILGVDYARESDESAITVIRIGELAEGDFDPFTPRVDEYGRPVLGRTTWNHICWAESWKQMEAHDMGNQLREIYTRFNIVSTVDVGGMALDKRGGGSAVRDALGNPRPDTVEGRPDPDFDWATCLKIYDPSDTKGYAHYAAIHDPMYWSGLRLLSTTNQDNIEWTYGTRALMQQKKLFLGFWEPPSRWAVDKGIITPNGEPDRNHPEYVKWETGYNGIRRLRSQLLRLQSKVSEQGVMGFTMPGDRTKDEGKKDLWASMIYAVSLLRQHLTRLVKPPEDIPLVMPLIV